MSQNPLIPSEIKNELSGNPDKSCRFKNAMFCHRGTVLLLFLGTQRSLLIMSPYAADKRHARC